MTDFDNPWKEILDAYFESFIAFFFPHVHGEIDWSRGHEMLDKELQQIIREAEVGKRWADVLVKVWRKNGDEVWVLIHVEVQSQEEAEFPKRMYVYNSRISERYDRPVASFAVLGDDNPNWRPSSFERSLWGCELGFRFPVVKLLDYAADWPALEGNPNPFTTVVMAHLKAKEADENSETRRSWKFQLVKSLYERGFDADKVRKLFKFIDWIMNLSKQLEDSFWRDVKEYEETKRMPYITSVQRIGREEGRLLGLMEAIESDLADKFGAPDPALMDEIRKITKPNTLKAFLKAVGAANSVQELRAFLTTPEKNGN